MICKYLSGWFSNFCKYAKKINKFIFSEGNCYIFLSTHIYVNEFICLFDSFNRWAIKVELRELNL